MKQARPSLWPATTGLRIATVASVVGLVAFLAFAISTKRWNVVLILAVCTAVNVGLTWAKFREARDE